MATATRPVIDGCAGPGGWDVAARALGLDPLGIELDDAACATREAAGLRTLKADVSALDPREVMREHFGGQQLEGQIFSPPCPSFSMAGKGEGRAAIPLYQEAMVRIGIEQKSVDRDELDEICGDPRAHLILEPLRWALALRPRWLALEQVEPCLPLWETMASCLRSHGYHTWTGVLSAEQHGVPQTRRRAFLLASLDGPVRPPVATHQRYIPPRKAAEATESLFDAPEPERIVAPEDRQLLPWVSMAEALGWGMTARPSITMTASEGRGGGPDPLDGGSGAWEALARERDAGRWAFDPRAAMGEGMIERHGPRHPVLATEPAPAITTKARSAEWVPGDRVGFPRREDRDGTGDYRDRDLRRADEPAHTVTERARSAVRFRANDQANATERSIDEPAPTITGGHDHGERQWVADHGATHLDGRQGRTRDDGSRDVQRPRPVSEPAPALRAAGLAKGGDVWVHDRPATTVTGTARSNEGGVVRPPSAERPERQKHWTDARPATAVCGRPDIFPPGHKINGDDIAAGRGGQRRSGAGPVDADGNEADGHTAVRVTLAEALVLQSFPPDYPVQGTKTKQFEQVGNAVPPLLAWAVLKAVVPA